MTDSDLNKAVHEKLEGKCVHEKVRVRCSSHGNTWDECLSCGTDDTDIPNYIADDAYVLGVVKKYTLIIGRSKDGRWAVRWASPIRTMPIMDKSLNRAVLLAALEKEDG